MFTNEERNLVFGIINEWLDRNPSKLYQTGQAGHLQSALAKIASPPADGGAETMAAKIKRMQKQARDAKNVPATAESAKAAPAKKKT